MSTKVLVEWSPYIVCFYVAVVTICWLVYKTSQRFTRAPEQLEENSRKLPDSKPPEEDEVNDADKLIKNHMSNNNNDMDDLNDINNSELIAMDSHSDDSDKSDNVPQNIMPIIPDNIMQNDYHKHHKQQNNNNNNNNSYEYISSNERQKHELIVFGFIR
eukprot:511911_1